MSVEPGTQPRAQRMAVVNGMACFILILVFGQLWLITATVDAFLGGDDSVVWPAAIASLICLGLNLGLLRYLLTVERS